MNNLATALLAVSMLVCSMTVTAGAMDVQVIGSVSAQTETISMNDVKVDETVKISGWGILTLTGFEIQDTLGYYKSGQNDAYYDSDTGHYRSGEEAEYVILYADILNTQLKEKNFLENVSVEAVYDDNYEFVGWVHQRSFDNISRDFNYLIEQDKGRQNIRWAISASDQFPIASMYKGHYIFGCTLPNAVIEGKEPLKLVITIDGDEIIYNIRK